MNGLRETSSGSDEPGGGWRVTFALAAGLFAIWGVAQWSYNSIFQQFAAFFAFSEAQSAGMLSLMNVAYFLLALPAALFHRRLGYKLGILFALSVSAIGPFLLYLSIIDYGYGYFIGAVLVMGAGWAWLETGLNPLAVEAGAPRFAALRLNAAQVFYALGLVVGWYLAQCLVQANYHLSVGAMAHAVARPYVLVGLGVLLLAYIFEQIKLPVFPTVGFSALGGELKDLLSRQPVPLGAAALFAYTLALNVSWSSNYTYLTQEVPGADGMFVGRIFLWLCLLFVVGRTVGAALMCRFSPARLLALCIVLAMAAFAIASAVGGVVGMWSLILSSLFLAITYPTVFALTIADLGPLRRTASGLLVAAAGLGGALGPLLFTRALAMANVRVVLLLTLPCLAVILVQALSAAAAEKAGGYRA